MGPVGYYPALEASQPLLWRGNPDGYGQACDRNSKPAIRELTKVPQGSLVT
jgi:hypothetical protein